MDSDKNSFNTSSDVVIINCDEKQKLRRKHCHRHWHNTKMRQESEHRRKSHSCPGNEHIKYESQNRKVQRIHFKCIINLNATVCDHTNDKLQRNHDSKSYTNITTKYKSDKDRTVPCCFRRSCRSPRYHSMESKERRYKKHCFNSKRKYEDIKRELKYVQMHRHSIELREKHRSHNPYILSPVSSSPFKNEYTHISYDEISNTSFEDSFTKPLSYKNVSESYNSCMDSKIDTLIKRTKERERKMREQSKLLQDKQTYASTPLPIEISSDEFPSSFSDTSAISIHSLSTFILGPGTDISSPEAQESNYLYCTVKEKPKLDCIIYSPTETIDSTIPKLPENDAIDIKIEPTLHLDKVTFLQNPTQSKRDLKDKSQFDFPAYENYKTNIKTETQNKPYSPSSPIISSEYHSCSTLLEDFSYNNTLKHLSRSVKSVNIKSEVSDKEMDNNSY